jgi:hypothetical protein
MMKKTIIDGISQRVLNDKMRRMLLTGALYLLLAEANDKEPDLVTLNSELGFLQDPRGFLLSKFLAHYWKSRLDATSYTRIPEDRLERYLVLIVPSWLRYPESGKYNMEQDVRTVVHIATA